MRTNSRLSFLLSALLLCGLTACGGGGDKNSQTSTTPTPTTPTAPITPTTPATPPPPTTPTRVYGAEFSLSPSGSDTNPGTPAAPFKTLEKARDAVRAVIAKGVPSGGVAVWLRSGVYERSSTMDLNTGDSGASASDSVDWRGYPGEVARVVGGRRLAAGSFAPVTSASPIWSRLEASAKGKVLQIDLKAQGITDFGTLKQRGFASSIGAALELFIDAQPMTLARWPDAGESTLLQDPMENSIEIFGTTTPDISGMYTKAGLADEVPYFQRNAPVNGLTYYLRRMTWVDNGNRGRAWFITANLTGWPKDANAWWSTGAELGVFHPDNAHATAGSTSALNPARLNHGYAHTAAPLSDVSFTYVGDRPERWTQARDMWVDGYWGETWAEFHLPVAAINPASRTLTLLNAPSSYGLKADRPWYAYNLLEEITQPGEWYLDRTSGLLYLWPPVGFGPDSDVVVSLQENALFALHGTTNFSFQNLTFEATRGSLLNISDGKSVTLANLVLRNSGSTMASVAGNDCLISRCRLTGAGGTAILLTGGDRKSLTAGNIRMEDCDVGEFARFVRSGQTGVKIRGCGNILRNSNIHGTPQSAIDFGGNNNLVELNEIYDVDTITTDAGAIYSGRDWGARGNIVRHNFIHRLHSIFGADLNGIYLDDCVSGIRIEGNIIYDVAGAALKLGGGRDNIVVNNLLIKCGRALYADSRAFEWYTTKGFPNNIPGSSWNLLEKLEQLGYQQQPWVSQFPECAAIPDNWTVITNPTNTWLYPEGSVFSRNFGWANFRWAEATAGTLGRYKEVIKNIEDQDPLFTDEANLNLLLKPTSPAFLIPGFEDIPFDEIGIRP